MGRVRVFAAPFVVTVALGGCKKASEEEAPKPVPRLRADARPQAIAVDARVAVAVPPDAPAKVVFEDPGCFADGPAHQVVACPDDVLPEAPAGTTTVRRADGCYLHPRKVWNQGRVRCPADGATIAVASVAGKPPLDGDISFDEYGLTCEENIHVDCPPPDEATCNPPPPRAVPCPAGLRPVLRAGLEPSRRDGDSCYWHAADGTPDILVDCPPVLPDAKPGAIVYGQGGACFTDFRVPVKCPADGAPILLGKLVLDDPIPWIYLQEGQLACFREQPYDCPVQPPGQAVSCNPPAPLPVECPDELMPRLRKDLEPDRKDGKCTYQGVQVRCP